MINNIKTYSTHINYWLVILTVVVIFGALLGSTGVARLKQMPRLTLIDVQTKDQLQGLVDRHEQKMTNLDHRITVIEQSIQTPQNSQKPSK